MIEVQIIASVSLPVSSYLKVVNVSQGQDHCQLYKMIQVNDAYIYV